LYGVALNNQRCDFVYNISEKKAFLKERLSKKGLITALMLLRRVGF